MKTLTALLLLIASCFTVFAQTPHMVKAGLPGNPANLTEYNGLLYFTQLSGGAWELWKSDGTDAGTKLVKRFTGGASGFADVKVWNNQLFLLREHELWKSNGSGAGTVLLKTFAPELYLLDLIAAGDKIYFRATSYNGINELWKSNGSVAGTVKVADISPVIAQNSDNDIPEFVYANGLLFFWSTTATAGTELWKSDGTAAGTAMVKDIFPGTASSRWGFYDSRITALENKVYFAADDGVNGMELWVSDGTESGTLLKANIAGGSASSFPAFMAGGKTAVGTTLFFNANDGMHGEELWRTVDTWEGAVLVKDIYPGHVGSGPAQLNIINGVLYFNATENVHGGEVWKSIGTVNHTDLVADVNPGVDNSDAMSFTNVSGRVFFVAKGPATGDELWTTNGFPSGTELVYDIRPGAASSLPQYLTAVGNRLFFAADDGMHGKQLWVYDTGARQIVGFTLLNAEADNSLLDLYEGRVISLLQPTDKLNIMADMFPGASIGSMVFELNGTQFSTENIAPYTLAGDNGNDYNAWTPATGEYELCATPWFGKNGTGIRGVRECVNFKVITIGVLNFTLVNAETNEDIFDFSAPPGAGDDVLNEDDIVELDLSGLPHPEQINIRVNTIPPVVGSVGIGLDGDDYGHQELTPPYAVFGDAQGDYKAWQEALPRTMGGSCGDALHWCYFSLYADPNNWEAGYYETSFYLKLKYDDIRVESFTLVNAVTNEDLMDLQEGDVIDLSLLPATKLNIRANTMPPVVGSVIFNGNIENTAPYALYGNSGNNYNDWQAVPGEYQLHAVPYSVAQSGDPYSDPKGVCGIPLSLSFRIIESGANKTGVQAQNNGSLFSGLQAFPNPNEGIFNVSFIVHEAADVKVEVYDLVGKLVYRDELLSFSGAYSRQLDLSAHGQGIYLLKVQEGTATTVVKKITVHGR